MPTRLEPGHLACAGCGAAIAMKIASSVLPSDSRVVIPAGCWSIILGRYPLASLNLPAIHTPFAFASAFATGIRAALDAKGQAETPVIAWAGDGATYDIGFGLLSAAAERRENILYICYDNEGYMNTGAQKSSATPYQAETPTTPEGKETFKKDIFSIMVAHEVAYAATASIAFPEDMRKKIQKALDKVGFKFILIHSPCPTGWGMDPRYTVKASRLAVETGLFPLVEWDEGGLKVSYQPSFTAVEEYMKLQARFSHSPPELLRRQVERIWNRIALLTKGPCNAKSR